LTFGSIFGGVMSVSFLKWSKGIWRI